MKLNREMSFWCVYPLVIQTTTTTFQRASLTCEQSLGRGMVNAHGFVKASLNGKAQCLRAAPAVGE